MDDRLLPIAFSVHNSRGAYALLLGSGISRPAEIPTGDQVVDVLIRRVAATYGETAIEDPIAWYEQRFQQVARYEFIVERLAPGQAERVALLSPYFEPTPEEVEFSPHAKRPTLAHKAIAQLIALGYIKIILTTNFDRLLEIALREIGIEPNVISSDDSILNALAPQHYSHVIYKLHGDYKDVRIRNSPEELSNYSSECNELLDQIFSQYGLIICGWSAKTDKALIEALSRAKQSRYTSYWINPSPLPTHTDDLVISRGIRGIHDLTADTFFDELHGMVEGLSKTFASRSLTPQIAVERLKTYIHDQTKQIQLEDLIRNEAQAAYDVFTSRQFILERDQASNSNSPYERIQVGLERYSQVCETPLTLLATLAFYGTTHHAPVVVDTVTLWDYRVSTIEPPSSYKFLPNLLLLYAVGIAATHRSNWHLLSIVFSTPVREDRLRDRSLLNTVVSLFYFNFRKMFGQELSVDDWGEFGIQDSIFRLLRPFFFRLIPSDDAYKATFDIFEMLMSFFSFEQTEPNLKNRAMVHDALTKRQNFSNLLSFWAMRGQELKGSTFFEAFQLTPSQLDKKLGIMLV